MKLLNNPLLLGLKGKSFFPRMEHYLAICVSYTFDLSNIFIFGTNISWPKPSFHITKKEVSVLMSTVFRGFLLIFSGQERCRFSLHF